MKEKLWYIVCTYTGYEHKVKNDIEMKKKSLNMEDNIFRIVIPEKIKVERNDGVYKEKIEKLFSGYILVEMILSNEAWYVIRNTPGVSGFIGSSGKGAEPIPLQPYEVDNILNQSGMKRIENTLKIGDIVKIIEGPFIGMSGNIVSVIEDNINVEIDLFGQKTPVEVSYNQVSMLN